MGDRSKRTVGDMYGLVVRFELKEGHEEAFDRPASETIEKITAKEPGTLAYIAHRVPSFPNTRIFYELYADEAAFAAHEDGAHTRQFLAERANHLRREPEVTFVSSGVGVVRDGVRLDGK
jgi:quinol monooxygenase YgiN